MKTIALIFHFSLLIFHLPAQTVTQKLQKAFTAFEKDTQLTHAISSLYVIDAQTGSVVFDKNSRIGLAPASTQKIITSVTAFELLGKDYRYKTDFIKSKASHSDGDPNLIIKGYGDPTFGSSRYQFTNPNSVFDSVLKKIRQNQMLKITRIETYQSVQDNNPIPGGYICEDIGNYYGAGTFNFNWRENQYDMILESQAENATPPGIISTEPIQTDITFYNFLKTGKPGSGDNAYIFSVPFSNEIFVRGTIPPMQKRFVISGSMPFPTKTFSEELYHFLKKKEISFVNTYSADGKTILKKDSFFIRRDFTSLGDAIDQLRRESGSYESDTIYTHYSPSLDSIIYWFNKKSINLYGEALIKTFAHEKQGFGSTDSGVAIVQKFWKEKGLSDKELNIVDGSGLSPLNRVTTHAQVEILKYAKNKDWFPSFYNSLPEYNGMKMKSGTIHDVKGFCGYHKAKNGKEYIFSFLVNNYNGSAGDLVKKMYTVLDNLK